MFKFTSETATATKTTATPRSNQKGSRIRERMMAAPNHYYPANCGVSHQVALEWFNEDIYTTMESEGLWPDQNYGQYLFGFQDRTPGQSNTIPNGTRAHGRDFSGQYLQVIESPEAIAKARASDYRFVEDLDGRTFASVEASQGLISWASDVLSEAERLGATAKEIADFAQWKSGKISPECAVDLLPLYAALSQRGRGYFPSAADSRILEAASRLHSSMDWSLPCSSMVGTNDHDAGDGRDLRELELMQDRRDREDINRPIPTPKTDILTDEMDEQNRIATDIAEQALSMIKMADTAHWMEQAQKACAAAILEIWEMSMDAGLRDRLVAQLQTGAQTVL